jgi:hypothetical protein
LWQTDAAEEGLSNALNKIKKPRKGRKGKGIQGKGRDFLPYRKRCPRFLKISDN